MTCNECYHCEICKRYPANADICVYAIEKARVEEALGERTVVNQCFERNYLLKLIARVMSHLFNYTKEAQK